MLLSSVEKLVNHLLATDTDSLNQLKKFSGKSVAVDFKELPLICYIQITPIGIKLSEDAKSEADCSLRGSPLSLLRYLNQRVVNPSINKSLDVEIEGDLELARELSAIFKRLEIDWEALIAQATGDLPARYLVSVLGSLRTGWGNSVEAAKKNLGYVINSRFDQTITSKEAEAFYKDIDELQADVERLEKTVAQVLREVAE